MYLLKRIGTFGTGLPVAALTVLRTRREPRERLAAPPPLEDIVDRRWRLELHRLLGLLDVEDPAVRLDAEAHLVAALHGGERHAAEHDLRPHARGRRGRQ